MAEGLSFLPQPQLGYQPPGAAAAPVWRKSEPRVAKTQELGEASGMCRGPQGAHGEPGVCGAACLNDDFTLETKRE